MGKAGMLKADGAKIRQIREALGLSRARLAALSEIHEVHLGKIERCEVKETSQANVEALADALGCEVSDISRPKLRSYLEVWAEKHGYSRTYAQQLATEGRIEGAYKGPDGMWVVHPEAAKLPPTEASRQKEREKNKKYRAEYQRRRRARRKKEGE